MHCQQRWWMTLFSLQLTRAFSPILEIGPYSIRRVLTIWVENGICSVVDRAAILLILMVAAGFLWQGVIVVGYFVGVVVVVIVGWFCVWVFCLFCLVLVFFFLKSVCKVRCLGEPKCDRSKTHLCGQKQVLILRFLHCCMLLASEILSDVAYNKISPLLPKGILSTFSLVTGFS